MTKEERIDFVRDPWWHVASEKTGRWTGEVPVEVVLLFDGGEDMGEFDQRDILPELLEVRVDFGSVAIDPETVDE